MVSTSAPFSLIFLFLLTLSCVFSSLFFFYTLFLYCCCCTDDDLGDLSGDGTGFPPHPPPAPSAAASASASSSSSSSMDIGTHLSFLHGTSCFPLTWVAFLSGRSRFQATSSCAHCPRPCLFQTHRRHPHGRLHPNGRPPAQRRAQPSREQRPRQVEALS